MNATVDVLVVGAGPVGLYAAYCAGFRGLSAGVVDSLPQAGGQINALYPEKLIFDIAGYPRVRGRDLVANLIQQAAPFDPVYLLGKEAQDLSGDANGDFIVTMSDASVVRARAIVITAGIGTFTPRALPAAAGFQGAGVSYFVPELQEHAGKDVVIVGGGDSAFDWALALDPIASSVTVVHRRDAFRAHEQTVKEVRAAGILILTPCAVTNIYGKRSVRGVDVVDLATKDVRTLPAQSIVAALGFTANLGPLETWGLRVDARRIVVDTRMSTTVPGVFAAGDVADYLGKVRLISVGFGEAATAVNNAATLIQPGADLFPGHSTEHAA
jgi:thioredoxin reductase (NADPH)